MSDQGKANYEAYRKTSGPLLIADEVNPEYEKLPPNMRRGFDSGADAVEQWLAAAPVDEDAPGSEPEPDPGYALVEMMGYRRIVGTVTETVFLGKPMLEVTALDTGTVQLIGAESLYQLTWLTRDQAERATRTGMHSAAAIAAADAEEFASWGDPSTRELAAEEDREADEINAQDSL